MEFTIESSSKGFVHRKKGWLVCQREEGDPNNVYTVTVKTDGTKTVQSKSYNNLLSLQLHLIIDLVLTQQKLAHGRVKFPACSINHFAMNIIMAKNWFNRQSKFHHMRYFRNPPKYIFPPKFLAIR